MSATTIQGIVIRLACEQCGGAIDVPVGFKRTVETHGKNVLISLSGSPTMHTCPDQEPTS